MPGPYEVLNARVKQKIDTAENWIAEEGDFGVIFEGEQAFVRTDDGTPVNFKIGDGTKVFSELPYFIAYYTGVTSQKILTYQTQTANITIAGVFRKNTLMQMIWIENNSGTSFDMNIGTTDGGSELGSETLDTGLNIIGVNKGFSAATTVYLTGLTGKAFNMFILYFQLDEAPAIPPTGGGSGVSFAYGTLYHFYPMFDGHETTVWDFGIGLGKTGTQYEGCILMGTNELDDLAEFYLTGYKVGQTIGGNIGNSTNDVKLVEANIPKIQLKLFGGGTPTGNLFPDPDGSKTVAWSSNHTSGNQDYDMKGNADSEPTLGHTSHFGLADPTGISVRPKSKIVLYFTGPATT